MRRGLPTQVLIDQRVRVRGLAAAAGAILRQQGKGRHRDRRHHAAAARLRRRSPCLASGGQCKSLCCQYPRRALAADPAGAAQFRANGDAYLAKLDALDREIRSAVAQIPPPRRKVISTHNAFGYFAGAYGIEFIAPLGVSTESEPSARDIAGIITQIKQAKIPAVFLENVSDPRLIQRIAAETGARLGGTLYSDGLTGEKGDAPTYIDMVRHNIKTLTRALGE